MSWDSYSSELFQGSELTEDWIEKCAAYLRFIFGESLDGERVLDYGFGRGNWSLAFEKLGATRVNAVDISQRNVEVFSRIVAERSLDNCIKCYQSDFQKRNQLLVGHSLIWLYGIFQHLNEPKELLINILKSDTHAEHGLLYAYEKNSIRSHVIAAFREFMDAPLDPAVLSKSKSSFTDVRTFRRCIDDYCAPTVNFFEESEIFELFEEIMPKASITRVPSFMNFLGDEVQECDFSAIHIHFSLTKVARLSKVDRQIVSNFPSEITNTLNEFMHATRFKNMQWKLKFLIDFHNAYYSCKNVTELLQLLVSFPRLGKLK